MFHGFHISGGITPGEREMQLQVVAPRVGQSRTASDYDKADRDYAGGWRVAL